MREALYALDSLARNSLKWLYLCLGLTVACHEIPTEGTLTTGRPPPTDFDRPIELLLQRELPPDIDHIRFGVTPYLSTDLMLKSYQPIADYLSDSLGIRVELVLADSYGDLITKVQDKELDIFLISPLSYVLAKNHSPDIQLLAQESAGGMASYSSYVIVRQDSRAQSLQDLVGKKIAFVDKNSTSGFLFPMAAFINAGITPSKQLEVCFSKSHVQAISDLIDKTVEAATVSSNMVNFTAGKKHIQSKLKEQGFRILHKAGRISYDALAARGDLSKSGLKKIQAAFAKLNTRSQRGRKALKLTAEITGWIPASEKNYDPVRRVLKKIKQHAESNPFPEERNCAPTTAK